MAEIPTPHAPLVKQTGLAVTTLVLGIIGLVICPLLGIAAIITGIIALARIGNEPDRYGGQGMAIAGLVCGCASILMSFFVIPMFMAMLLPSLSRARELSQRLVCASNMKGISTVMKIYSQDFEPQGTPGLEWLIDGGYISPEGAVCPSSDAGISNYVLVPAGGDATAPPQSVLMYEPLSNHGGEGANVVFPDGHVEFVEPERFDELVGPLSGSPP